MAGQHYEIVFDQLARTELSWLRVFEQRRIEGAILSQLTHEPNVRTRNRKPVNLNKAGFVFNPPLWELKIGSYRAFYEIDELTKCVTLRAIRFKGPKETTEGIVQ